MEEGIIVTLENGSRYYLIKETRDEETNKKYFLAVGITDQDDINYTEIALFLAEKEGNDEYLTRLDPSSQEYINIITEQFYDNLIEENPGIEDALIESLEKIVNKNETE